MAQVNPVVDVDKAAWKDQYVATRAQLQVIQDTMQASPTPTQAYASIDYMASTMDKILKVLNRIIE